MKILRTGVALGIILLLAQACSTPLGDKFGWGNSATEATETTEYAAQTGLTDQQRFLEVINLLEDGDPRAARVELKIYLDAHPNSDVARDLLLQIDMPATEYFPEDSKDVLLVSGQSLSSLSTQFLDDPYKFHALAKYNGIVDPRAIKVGQTIRIPLTNEARRAFASRAATSDGSVGVVVPDSKMRAASQADELHEQAVDAFHRQDLDKAIAIWDQVLEIDPNYKNARLQRSQAIELRKKLSNLN